MSPPALAALALVATLTAPSPQTRADRALSNLMPAVQIKGETHRYSLRERMAYYHVPSVSIAFFDKNGIIWTRSVGAGARTLFQAGSISKPVAAVGIMHVVQQGKLSLDTAVNGELKTWKVPDNAFTAKQPVTLRELLSHTAGTTVHGFEGYERGKPVPTLVQVLNGTKPANSPPIRVDIQPATQYRYSGGGYVIAEQLLLDTVHEPFATYMHDTVLAPFGMTDSTYEQPLPRALWNRAAVAADSDGKPYPGKWHVYPEQTAAGLWTTPSDLAKFAIAVNAAYDGTRTDVISQSTAHTMLTAVKDHYGLGFGVRRVGASFNFGHEGANAGFEADLTMYHDGQGVAIMTDSDNGGELIGEIESGIAAEYGWSDRRPAVKSVVPMSAAQLAQFTGTYKSADIGTLVVSLRRGVLYAEGGGQTLRLYPENATTFFILEQPIDIRFNKSGGRVTSVTLVQPNVSAPRIK